MRASAMVVLPEPDSPIRASTSPFSMVKPTFFTIGMSTPSLLRATTWRSVTSMRALMSALFAQVIDEQVYTDGQRGDCQCRHQDGRRSFGQPRDIFPHQRTPVGVRWLDTEAKEGQAREQQNDEHETQSEIGEHRADHIG